MQDAASQTDRQKGEAFASWINEDCGAANANCSGAA